MRRVCEITVTLDFIFRLVVCSTEDVLFNISCLDELEGIEQLYVLMWFNKSQLDTPFKCEYIKVLMWTLGPLFSKNVHQIAAFLCFFGFQW